jgi:type II secretory pathway component GspD/PulD (secretin)
VFYLRTADATETAQMLERLFPQSTVTSSASSSSDLLGSFSSGMSSFGRGMMSATGLSGSTLGAQALRIITDTRQNALFVSGPSDKVAEVEQMLQILDTSDLPQSLRDRLPRNIPVLHADVDEVCEIVESVFKDAINPEPVNQGGNRGGFNPLAMLMGQQGGQGNRQRGPELTLGIDRRTSNLIVSCNDSLFRQIEELVASIDRRARDARQTVKVVPLATADPSLVSSTITALMPKVTVSSTRGRSSSSPTSSRTGQPGTRTGSGGSGSGESSRSSGGPDADAIRRMMEFRSQGGFGGGDRGGGDRGGFGGDRGGSSRGSFFGGDRGGDRGR